MVVFLKKKKHISEKSRHGRVVWAKAHKSLSKRSQVLFTGETRIQRICSSGRVYVWRSKDEKYKIKCTRPSLQGGGGGIIVWGSITANDPGPLVRIDGSLDTKQYCKLLIGVVDPYTENEMSIMSIYQHDNAPSRFQSL